MRDEHLDDFAEGLEDAVVEDTGRVEADGGVFEAGVHEFVGDALVDVADGVEAEVVGEGVDFVDEDGVFDVAVRLLQVQDCLYQVHDRVVVFVLRVEDPDHGADTAEDAVGVEGGVEVVDLAGEVPDLEFHEGAVEMLV